ncbi:hypothetical protein KPATCC21470_7684 [Kitasatospora purpeofusca]
MSHDRTVRTGGRTRRLVASCSRGRRTPTLTPLHRGGQLP